LRFGTRPSITKACSPGGGKSLEIRYLLQFISRGLALLGEQLEALPGGLQGGKRAGEDGLLHGYALQFLLFPAPVYTALSETDIEQGSVGSFLSR
jgi:hypothetical protein